MMLCMTLYTYMMKATLVLIITQLHAWPFLGRGRRSRPAVADICARAHGEGNDGDQ